MCLWLTILYCTHKILRGWTSYKLILTIKGKKKAKCLDRGSFGVGAGDSFTPTAFRKNFFKLSSHVLYFNPQNTSSPFTSTILTYVIQMMHSYSLHTYTHTHQHDYITWNYKDELRIKISATGEQMKGHYFQDKARRTGVEVMSGRPGGSSRQKTNLGTSIHLQIPIKARVVLSTSHCCKLQMCVCV